SQGVGQSAQPGSRGVARKEPRGQAETQPRKTGTGGFSGVGRQIPQGARQVQSVGTSRGQKGQRSQGSTPPAAVQLQKRSRPPQERRQESYAQAANSRLHVAIANRRHQLGKLTAEQAE